MDWCESVSVPMYKKIDRSSWESHTEMSLGNISSKELVGDILYCSYSTPGRCTREKQASFHPGRDNVDQIFNLRQTLEHKHIFCRPAISVFLHLTAMFDSVECATFPLLFIDYCGKKSISLIHSLREQLKQRL